MRGARLNDESIVLPGGPEHIAQMSDLFTKRGLLLIRARRVEVHPPALLICSPLGRLAK